MSSVAQQGAAPGGKLAKDKYSLCAYLPERVCGSMGEVPVPLIVLFR